MLNRLDRETHGRRFLFLQGLSTPLFFKLGHALKSQGHYVFRINICPGDHIFWPYGSDRYAGRFSGWPRFLSRYLAEKRITDIVLFGERRPYHRIALTQADSRGIQVHAFDEGYLRPDWITMGRQAKLREDLAKDDLLQRSEGLPSISTHERVGGGFARRAFWDVGFHTANVALRPLYPFYVRHRPHHPLIEGLSWVRRATKRWYVRRRASAVQNSLLASSAKLFLLPLQLDSDFQIRHHSPYRNMGGVMEHVFSSFAAHAPAGSELVVKVHPLDNGLIDRPRQVAELAMGHGLSGRVHLIDGGHLPTLLNRSSGVVVVNSTTGLAAMHYRKPTYALANPIYKLPGLVSPGTIDQFWTNPLPPRPDHVAAFERVLADLSQVNGSYFTSKGMNLAVRNIMLRLGGGSYASASETIETISKNPALP